MVEFEAALVEMVIRHRNRQSSEEPDGKSRLESHKLEATSCTNITGDGRNFEHCPSESPQGGRVFGRRQLDVRTGEGRAVLNRAPFTRY